MNWTSKEIRHLRLRLGWPVADFSRRFGCQAELIHEWENGARKPSPEDMIQMNRLSFQLNSYSEQVARGPMAECALNGAALAQVCAEQIPLILKDT